MDQSISTATVSLKDLHILKTLCLDLTGKGIRLENGVHKVSVLSIRRITYSLLHINMVSIPLLSSLKGKNMLLASNVERP